MTSIRAIKSDTSKPAPEIVHPLLSNRQAQIERARAFLDHETGDSVISSVSCQAIPSITMNHTLQVSGDGKEWSGIVESVTLNGSRAGTICSISIRRKVEDDQEQLTPEN